MESKEQLQLDFPALSSTLQQPDWYLTLAPLMRQIQELRDHDGEASEKLYHSALDFFQKQLVAGKVRLGMDGPNWDAERKLVDTIVIHHSSRQPGLPLAALNALHLLRLYAPEYANSKPKGENIKGTAIYSHHFLGGKQVFFGYHWLFRMDGSAERLLDDSAIGWHAGNWDINCRSIAICLDNDYENSEPDPQALQSLAEFIRKSYPHVAPDHVIGHCEANKNRTCPGALFLPSWKAKLLVLLEK